VGELRLELLQNLDAVLHIGNSKTTYSWKTQTKEAVKALSTFQEAFKSRFPTNYILEEELTVIMANANILLLLHNDYVEDLP